MEKEVEYVQGAEGMARCQPPEFFHQVGLRDEGGQPKEEGCREEESVSESVHLIWEPSRASMT